MPIIHDITYGVFRLLLWQITETAEELGAAVTTADIESARRFSNPRRRAEHLAWRAALRHAGFAGEITYDECGAPAIGCCDIYIGVAHTHDMAAVVLSPDSRCAVDIERGNRHFGKTVVRFITAVEWRLPGADLPLFPVSVWCAKETMYKLSGRKELDLLKDIAVTGYDPDRSVITGRILSGDAVRLDILQADGYVIVFGGR